MFEPIVSLCIPTNGIIEWVVPVLESIYAQGVAEELFEVIVSDNGSNNEFENIMTEYASRRANLVYQRTSVKGFHNQTESYRIARGQFIKFINHRMQLLPGALQKLIDFAHDNSELKPVVYFSNGRLKNIREKTVMCNSFDEFVNTLSYWSSWSAGIAFWKEDIALFETLNFNSLFPHTAVLFSRKDREKYIVDNRILLFEIPTNWALKGDYDLFHAFAVEYLGIIFDLYRSGDISKKTFLNVKKENFTFISERYIIYVFLGKKSSFDLKGVKDSINVFYSMSRIRFSILRLPVLAIRILRRRKSYKFPIKPKSGEYLYDKY